MNSTLASCQTYTIYPCRIKFKLGRRNIIQDHSKIWQSTTGLLQALAALMWENTQDVWVDHCSNTHFSKTCSCHKSWFQQWGIKHEHLQITEFRDAIGYKARNFTLCEAHSYMTTFDELFLGMSGHKHQLHQYVVDITQQLVYGENHCYLLKPPWFHCSRCEFKDSIVQSLHCFGDGHMP